MVDALRPCSKYTRQAAIAVHHAPIVGQSIGKHDLVVRFLRKLTLSLPGTCPLS